MKDAAASSIYGSRAPFGVILITTKSGKAGRTSVNYSTNVRFKSPMSMPEMMDSWSFANYWNEAGINQNGNIKFTQDVMDKILAFQQGTLTGPDAAGIYGKTVSGRNMPVHGPIQTGLKNSITVSYPMSTTYQ